MQRLQLSEEEDQRQKPTDRDRNRQRNRERPYSGVNEVDSLNWPIQNIGGISFRMHKV